MKDRTGISLDEAMQRIAPRIRGHGGDIQLSETSPGVVEVHLTGTCAQCQLRPFTYATVIEPELRAVDGVDEIRAPQIKVPPSTVIRIQERLQNSASGETSQSRKSGI